MPRGRLRQGCASSRSACASYPDDSLSRAAEPTVCRPSPSLSFQLLTGLLFWCGGRWVHCRGASFQRLYGLFCQLNRFVACGGFAARPAAAPVPPNAWLVIASVAGAHKWAHSDASFVRLRRALDRVAGAHVLMGASAEIGCMEGASGAAMRATVESLASEWPEDYPAGAVEWLLAGA
jgi:hypothetical protein